MFGMINGIKDEHFWSFLRGFYPKVIYYVIVAILFAT
jgi:hypothetical protein